MIRVIAVSGTRPETVSIEFTSGNRCSATPQFSAPDRHGLIEVTMDTLWDEPPAGEDLAEFHEYVRALTTNFPRLFQAAAQPFRQRKALLN